MKTMTRSIFVFGLIACTGCGDDESELPDGPCNSDGETGALSDGETSGSAIEPGNLGILATSPSTLSMAPPRLSVRGWTFDEETGLFLRTATHDERRRYEWAERTILVALPVSPFDQSQGDHLELTLPIAASPMDAREGVARRTSVVKLSFDRVQDLVLGTFVEHRVSSSGSNHEVSVPTFSYFNLSAGGVAGENGAEKSMRGELLALYSDQQFVMRAWTNGTGLLASGPHDGVALDPPPPLHYYVFRVTLTTQDLTMSLQPYACENGACEDPDDPLDECNDDIDNDGDGHQDLCDWNCLPHADFGADGFPEARSRVEAGKSYAIMGHGSLCTAHPGTWEVEFADVALNASELLNSLRPDLGRPVRYRTFSCWVFESEDAYKLCQFGPYEAVGNEPVYSPPICPPGMEAYPYQPTEQDQGN